MLSLLSQVLLRYLARHKVLFLLDGISVAIGVAVYLAIQSANYSANQAFRSSIDLVAGKSHLEVRGSTGTIAEDLFPRIAAHPAVLAATPLLEGYATLPNVPGGYLHIIGSDPFTNYPFQTIGAAARQAETFQFETWLRQPRSIMVHPDLLARTGTEVGGTVQAEMNGSLVTLTITGALSSGEVDRASSGSLAVMDIGWAQELLGETGRLTSVQILLKNPSDIAAARRALTEILPPDAVVQAPEQRSEQIQRMMDGFQLNITALSVVSILVGVFLIYNSVSASVVRRRREIGILRSNGASKGQVRLIFLMEGMLLGIPGVLLGIPLGIWLANGLVGKVSETISSLYVLVNVQSASLAPFHVILAMTFGLGATLLGAFLPALEASEVPPLSALRPNEAVQPKQIAGQRWLRYGLASLALALLFSWMALATGPRWMSFLACTALIAGFSLATPWICLRLSDALTTLHQRSHQAGILTRIAIDDVRRSLHRSTVTVAALMLAVSMTIGVTVMVSSFRSTVNNWVHHAMKADYFLAPAANQVLGFVSFIPGELIQFLEDQAGVADVETYRDIQLAVDDERTVTLGVVNAVEHDTLRFMGGNGSAKMKAFFEPGRVLATEAFSRRHDLSEGDTVVLPTPEGDRSFEVAGIYYDYSDDQGKLVMSQANFTRYWKDSRVHSIAIYLKDPGEGEALMELVRQEFGKQGELSIYSNRGLREEVFRIFDQTFAVTYVLRTIAIAVAVIGVGLSLATLVMERTRAIGILRSMGASRNQVRQLYLTEAALLGFFSSVIGILCGLGMAMILTWVVNKAFFGWTIQLQIPWMELALTPLWVVGIAILAGILPASNAARLSVNQAVRI